MVDDRHLVFQIGITLIAPPKITLKTYGNDVAIKDVEGFDEVEVSLSTIDTAMRLVDATLPCIGQPIEDVIINSEFLRMPVSGSRLLSVTTHDLGKHKRLISLSCCLLTRRGKSACKNCMYAFKLLRNREYKRKATDSMHCTPRKKSNVRFLNRTGLEEKITSQRKLLENEVKRDLRRIQDGEMIEFVDEDNSDLVKIFETTDTNTMPPEMKLLWDQQIKQLSAKSTKSYRWNPRFDQFYFTIPLY